MKTQTIILRRSLGILFFAFAFIFTSCQQESLPEVLKTADLSSNASPAATKGEKSIGTIAIENGNFTQLVDALVYTGLADTFVNGTDQHTVFAPTDAAFEDLYTALNITSIRDLPVDLVKNVLLYHVTDGRRFSNSVLPKKKTKEIQTLNGKSFYVNAGGGIDTNDADQDDNAQINFALANISASNGVIHVIDHVLLPQ